MDNQEKNNLISLAYEIRIGILEQLKHLGFGHSGGALSIADVLAVLYGKVMNIDPVNPAWEQRDKLVCSKGHAGLAVYSVLAVKGYFPYEMLKTLNCPGTSLPSHCDRLKTPGIDMTAGSLGQGTSVAVGMAFAKKIKGTAERVFLIVGDGESQEGQVWEAAMFAGTHQLDNLYWFVDANKKQIDGYTREIIDLQNIDQRLESFGFDAVKVNGNDVEAICEAIARAETVKGKPHAIVLDTQKACGVPELENIYLNHAGNYPFEQWEKWQDNLKKEYELQKGGVNQ